MTGFFKSCPGDLGIAYVLISHLDPNQHSSLPELIQRGTEMPVSVASNGVQPLPNHVYVIPPDHGLKIANGRLQLIASDPARSKRRPIDGFMTSLAEDLGAHSIGIVLSGTGRDGTLGLGAIEDKGGCCIVQDPDTAQFPGMPQSALAAGTTRYVVAVEKMPALLREVVSRALPQVDQGNSEPIGSARIIDQILTKLGRDVGHDFSQYKKNTVMRRIERRMSQIGISSVSRYADHLQTNTGESERLFRDLLINVTSFFRDPQAFEALKSQVLKPMLEQREDGYTVRVWVPACASGEEAYSIAMILLELVGDIRSSTGKDLGIQIYATDLDAKAIAHARAGFYPPNIIADVGADRLLRFFNKQDHGFTVKKELRNTIVFAEQSVIKDPPFRRLDLLSCRNLLIYFGEQLQSRLFSIFHYALNEDGVLFLSASENIASHPQLFSAIDRKWKIYRASHSAVRFGIRPSYQFSPRSELDSKATSENMEPTKKLDLDDLARRALLHLYAPPSVLTDVEGTILYVYGDTSAFLRPAPGMATLNVLEMAHDSLQTELRGLYAEMVTTDAHSLVRTVATERSGSSAAFQLNLRKVPVLAGDMAVPVDDGLMLLSMTAISVESAQETAADEASPPIEGHSNAELDASQRADQLAIELAYVRANQQAIIHEQRGLNEELKSANEELQSTNEELQSSNEELETAKEELQSLNEELVNVNGELNAKIEQWSEVKNDLKNLLDSVDTGIIFLDCDLRIRRYTSRATRVYRLIESDRGRPITDITTNLIATDLIDSIRAVVESLVPIERELRAHDGTWYLMRVEPYSNATKDVVGVVLTFTTITDLKLASEAALRNAHQLQAAQQLVPLGIWEYDVDGQQWHYSNNMAEMLGVAIGEQAIPQPPDVATEITALQTELSDEQRYSVANALPYQSEQRIIHTDGSSRTILSRGVPIVDISGRVTHLVGVSLEVDNARLPADRQGSEPGKTGR